MRGTASMILTFIIVIVILVLYIILGRSQMTAAIRRQQEERDALDAKLLQIAQHETEMRDMTEMLPQWRSQLTLFRRAIPENINDDVFITSLNEQLAQNNVKLLNLELSMFGSWLKDVDEQTIESLRGAGLDVETMRKIQVAFFDIRLSGEFKDVITSFENLKRYGRLFTIDLVTTEGQGGGGAVTEIVDANKHPLMLSGAIFYGIPPGYVDPASLDSLFVGRFTGPLARSIYQNMLKNAEPDEPSAQSGNKDKNSTGSNGKPLDKSANQENNDSSYSSAGALVAQGA